MLDMKCVVGTRNLDKTDEVLPLIILSSDITVHNDGSHGLPPTIVSSLNLAIILSDDVVTAIRHQYSMAESLPPMVSIPLGWRERPSITALEL
jgi:hypothetical protein